MEERLKKERGSEERKQRQLMSLGLKESQYLRLRRTRLTLDAFQTIKVIGKGAFGEVSAAALVIIPGSVGSKIGYRQNIRHENAA